MQLLQTEVTSHKSFRVHQNIINTRQPIAKAYLGFQSPLVPHKRFLTNLL